MKRLQMLRTDFLSWSSVILVELSRCIGTGSFAQYGANGLKGITALCSKAFYDNFVDVLFLDRSSIGHHEGLALRLFVQCWHGEGLS